MQVCAHSMQWSEGDRVFTGQGWRLQVIAFLCGNEPAREDVSPNDTEATTSLVVAAPTKFKQIPPLLLAWLAVGAHAQRARLAHRRRTAVSRRIGGLEKMIRGNLGSAYVSRRIGGLENMVE